MAIITMAHGSGGRATSELIDSIFAKYFNNEILSQMEDSSVVDGSAMLAMTTDSFVVKPLTYPGGNIGRLSVCGTVNDLLMRGSVPKYLTCGFILEEGLDTELLSEICKSMAETAKEANVKIVAGDTKVIEGSGGLIINTAGVGFINPEKDISSKNCKKGDKVIVSGYLGDHHATILSSRMNIDNNVESDNAPLNEMVLSLINNNIKVHALRDITRGGLATVLKEMAISAKVNIELEDDKIPVNPMIKDFYGILGLDPLYMGNEGKLVAIVAEEDAEKALSIIKNSKYGENAVIAGEIVEDQGEKFGNLTVRTVIGGLRSMEVLQGEGLPRIC